MIVRTAAEWFTPVKATGMAAYLIASAVCGLTAARAPGMRVPRLASILCALDFALFVDITFDLRWKFYAWFKGAAIRHNLYSERSEPQVVALIALAVGLLVLAVRLSRRFASIRGAPLAVFGGLLSIGCWLAELISLHAVDAILYRYIGPLMVVCFVWILACAMTVRGILIAGSDTLRKLYSIRLH
jgi:hypothetical protein